MPAFWMIVSCLLFACMGVCVKLASSVFSTGEIVFWRGLVSMLMMAGLALSRGIGLSTPHWRMHLSRSISGSTALVCYFFAIGALPLATAVTLNYTSPLFLALLLALVMGERLNALASGAVLMGFAGVVLLLRPTLQPEQWLGAAVGLGSGALASLAYLSLRELGRKGEPEVRTVFWFSLMTTVIGLAWSVFGELHLPDLRQLATLLGVGLFGGLAQLAMTRSYRYGRTVVSANLSYATVVFASLFGMLLWDEIMPASAWLAVALIVAGAILVSLSTRKTA
ncbi:Riboflavin transporter [Thauera sp. GDN1]|uniref:DMT family transporter n=1 Tax=Thauera sp. GDN1 TaxID=2944810 RepID=UPI00247A0890|nr:DMT family transporter [Thauera sp. GDN1]WEN43276.1 Riboflavin transporter [Thauera sp. GDN1]